MSNCEHMFLRVEGFSSNLYIQKSLPINFQKLKPKSKWGQDCLTAMTFHPSSADNNCCPRQHKLMHQCTKQHDSQQQKNKSENRIKLLRQTERIVLLHHQMIDFLLDFVYVRLLTGKKTQREQSNSLIERNQIKAGKDVLA